MHIQNVNITLGHGHGALGAAVLAALFSGPDRGDAVPAQAPSTRPVPPAIGEYWEGEGGIYVGMGRGRDGGRDYCLILPTEPRAIFAKRSLGTYGIDVTGATSDHDGMANTNALADAGSDLCKEIRALEIDGHSDFYLMSRTDARLCMTNVQELFEKEWYLTSTQYSAAGAWAQVFGNGVTGTGYKKFEASARACRRSFL